MLRTLAFTLSMMKGHCREVSREGTEMTSLQEIAPATLLRIDSGRTKAETDTKCEAVSVIQVVQMGVEVVKSGQILVII